MAKATGWKTCNICGSRMKASKFDGHMKNVHPKGVKTVKARNRIINRRRTASGAVKWTAVGAIIVLSILLVSYGWALLNNRDIRGSNIGNHPYDFILKSCDGPTYSLDDDLGQRPILLEFAKHDCGGCQYMCTVLNNLYTNYSSRVVFVTLISDPPATMQDVREFKYSHNSEWTFLYDRDGIIYNKYGNDEYPTFYMIGQDGTILWTSKTADPYDSPSIATYSEMEHNLTMIL